MPRILLRSWVPGLRKISLVDLLQEKAGLSLTAAKKSVDDLVLGNAVTIQMENDNEAARLADEIKSLGGICDVVEEEHTGD